MNLNHLAHTTLAVFILTISPSASAQTGPKEAASAPIPMTPEQIAARIPEVEAEIHEREIRASELTQDIIQLDERIEGRIDRILKQLHSMKDSKESGTRVVRMKKDAIEGLMETIEYYDVKRRELNLEAFKRDPRIERENLFEDIAIYDQRIEKRVNQILELANTFTEHKNLPKYTYSRSGRWGGRTRKVSDAYRDNRSQTVHTEQTRKELIDALKKSIDGLDRRNRDIKMVLQNDITDQYRELLQQEYDQNEALMIQREEQVHWMMGQPSGGGKATSTKSAMTTGNLIDELVDDIQSDFDEMFADIHELNQERMALAYLRERLEAARKEAAAAPAP